MQEVEKTRKKLEASIDPKKRPKSRKFKLMEKEYAKRKQKFDEAKMKAINARNEYLLFMNAANSSIKKYFDNDLRDLIDVSWYFFKCVDR